MSDPNDYTIGWISAFLLEYVAAQLFLEKKDEKLRRVHPNDNNHYTLGRIGDHRVAMAVLAAGQHGVTSASLAAAHMWQTFPNLRMCLMVGIGGGVPGEKHDIRLGDVVVSCPTFHKKAGNLGGVVQYDYYKTIRDGHFQSARFLNDPPRALLNAVEGLRAVYKINGNHIDESISAILEEYTRLKADYSRPDPSTDNLYSSVFSGEYDRSFPDSRTSFLIQRPKRAETEDNPAVHYGLIASADSFMEVAQIRDLLSKELDVLCFEMEAAGLMNDFPCLVIRGICDYSDEHSSKEWQGYAAMTASAYARDLLHEVVSMQVYSHKKISDVVSGFHEFAEENLKIAKEQLQRQKDLAKERLSKEEHECHQLFRLTTGSRDTTYEWYKDRVEDRIDDTCMWFLEHGHFQAWLNQDFGPLLVTADPGCGKSVLAKYLIDHKLPRLGTICYFFFKDQDQNTARQALCAILHQLFSQNPSLIKHAMAQLKKDGKGIINATESLWKILRNSTNDPQAGPVIVVLDALDECLESEFVDLIRNIEKEFGSAQLGYTNVKYLLTCRTYEQIVSRFRGLLGVFPKIHIPGEQESEIISQEVNSVITHRVNQLSTKQRLSPRIKAHLDKRLKETTHRTYLWVHLVFEYLEEESFKKTERGLDIAIGTLPTSINEAYEQILNKSKQYTTIKKALSIVLAASRPLTLSEMNFAMNIDHTLQSVWDLDLEEENDFESRLRSWCGLFLSIYNGRIYFLHQTAREFLLAEFAPTTGVPSHLHWCHSITTHQAHAVLAEICVLYINCLNIDTDFQLLEKGFTHSFLLYSADQWGGHFRASGMVDDSAIMPLVLRICDPHSKSYPMWFTIYWAHFTFDFSEMDLNYPAFTRLVVASHLGHLPTVKLLLQKGHDINAKNSWNGQTPLSMAAGLGYYTVVELLLDKGADIEAEDYFRQTPLSIAIENKHEEVVKLLLEKGANPNTKRMDGQTSLSLATWYGYSAIANLLLDKGVNVDAKFNHRPTPLLIGAKWRRGAIVKMLLEKGADTESKDSFGSTPLLIATERGFEEIVELLIKNGVNIDSKDCYGRTSLFIAVKSGYWNIIQLLLNNGADIESTSNTGQTPLSVAAERGHNSIVKLLLRHGADTEAKDYSDHTPLWWAHKKGHRDIVQLLETI